VLLVVYAIGCDWGGRSLGALAALGLLTLPMFQRSALQDSNDLWMTFFFVLAVWRTGRLVQRPSYGAALLLGGVLGAGLLTKYTMLLLLPTMAVLVWLLPPPGAPPAQGWDWRVRLGWLGRLLPYLAVVWGVGLAALTAWVVHAVQIGVLGAQVERISGIAGLTRNDSGAVRLLTARRVWTRLDLLSMRLPAALGVYAIPLLWQGVLTTVRRRDALDVRVWAWLLIIFVPVIATFPEPRYFMPAYAALTLLMALGALAAPRPTARWLALAYCFGNLTLYAYVA
jgi:4-amino-4-deoxy-L-arabinose transferase-like glycosyltransferase